LYALDAAPAFAAFGFNLAHLFFRMMRPAVVTEQCIGHGSLEYVTRKKCKNNVAAPWRKHKNLQFFWSLIPVSG
jgi:hypothetical protein